MSLSMQRSNGQWATGKNCNELSRLESIFVCGDKILDHHCFIICGTHMEVYVHLHDTLSCSGCSGLLAKWSIGAFPFYSALLVLPC